MTFRENDYSIIWRYTEMIDNTPMPVLEIRQGKRRSVIQCDSSYFAGRRNFLKFPFVACQLILAKRQVT